LIPSDFSVFDALETIDLYTTMIPAREVGGDFYDFFFIDPDHLGVCIADVSGKGVGAALFMAVVRTMLRSNAMHGLSVHDCISRVNQLLASDNKAHLFLTLFYGVLDLGSGRLDFCNAGHYYPFLLNPSAPPRTLQYGQGIGLKRF
jgi:sigma-B regulation protein RsbU (phosphoserine phosphatase)